MSLISIPASAWRFARQGAALLCAGAMLLAGGCAIAPAAAPPAEPIAQAETPEQTCARWYRALDTQVEAAGVRDAGATPVVGHAYLRVDRFTASLTDRLPAQPPGAAILPAPHAAWLARLQALDASARHHELSNLPASARQALATGFGLAPDTAAMHLFTRDCGARLAASELGTPWQIDRLRETLVVPDDYVDAYRASGLYPLTRIPFLAGVRRFEAETRQRFADAAVPPPGRPRLRLAPPTDASAPALDAAQLRAMLRAAADNALGIPMPTAAQREQLFQHFAPIWDLGVAGIDDLPGALYWADTARDDPQATPRVDVHRPAVYRQLAHTRFGERSLLQLVYTVWFGARSATRTPIDLLAGRIDGLVWRVTLSPDGQPLVYDSIHPCGCYHMFFPVPGIAVRDAPSGVRGEWAFSPRTAPTLAPGERLVLRLAAATHYLEALDVQPANSLSGAHTVHGWRDYDELRALPLPGGRSRSVFDRHGFMPGTDRLESWLFWPMGIARAGAMRQWGRQATAFVGRRHFDDARLIEQRFELGAAALPAD